MIQMTNLIDARSLLLPFSEWLFGP